MPAPSADEKAGFRLVARGELDPDNPIADRLHEILRIDRPGTRSPTR